MAGAEDLGAGATESEEDGQEGKRSRYPLGFPQGQAGVCKHSKSSLAHAINRARARANFSNAYLRTTLLQSYSPRPSAAASVRDCGLPQPDPSPSREEKCIRSMTNAA